MNNKLVTVLIAGILVLTGVQAFRDTSVTLNVPESPITVGSQVGPEHNEAQFFYGGVSGKVSNFVSTTTQACSVQNTTGKWVSFVASFRTTRSTTTTTVLGLSTTTDAGRWATTTAIASKTVAANSTATSTYVGANNQNILAPGEWVHYGYGAGTTLPTVAQQQSGTCNVLFYVI